MLDNKNQRKFAANLKSYLDGAGETSLLTAYEIGRQALSSGASVLDITAAYNKALAAIMRERTNVDAVGIIESAEPFLFECLSPFEMSQKASREANAILRRLNHMLEDEAGRIAHALHDEAGGILASARMKLDLAVRDIPPAMLERMEQVRELLDQTGEQLRHLSHELRPMILDDLGLLPALKYLAQGFRKRTGLNTVVLGKCDRRPPAAAELAIYKSVQEALNNIVRHGGEVNQALVRLATSRTCHSCSIEDDGDGFNPQAMIDDRTRTTMGLAGMRERIHAVGGSLEIKSVPGNGTTISIQIPRNVST